MQDLAFLRAFLKNWKQVGWPLQTSRSAARKICDAIDFHKARRVIEIGAGTGNVTRELLKCLRADAQLIVFEIDRDLCQHLRAIDDRRLVVYNASGFQAPELLTEKADYVISEVPIAVLSNTSLNRFYDGVKVVLHENGYCIQVQLSLLSYQKLKRVFRTVTVAFTLMNSLPMFIYRCRGSH
jgi:phosphatidylethanolamine/phosphatidyl-N-methylethanolamine N-methyltransferase